MKSRPLLTAFCSLLALPAMLSGAPALAVENDDSPWAVCHHDPNAAPAPLFSQAGPETAPTEINADRGSAIKDVYTLEGKVVIRRAGERLTADQAVYDDATKNVEATGGVYYEQSHLILEGDSARMNLDSGKGEIDQARYGVPDRHGRGDARTIIREGADLTRLKQATYTTCDPGHNDWYLSSQEVKLNHAEGVGSARNVLLHAQNIPFLYLPYISFPINNERRSGMLTPKFGQSSETGFDLQVPVYWNIAPNYDATITPRYLARRGVQAQTEFRYLTRGSHGIVNLEYLPDDRIYGGSRAMLALNHTTALAPRWRTDVVLNHVSDIHYFEELGGSLSAASITHTEQRADLIYQGDYSSALMRVQGYKTVDASLTDPATKPYQRLPQITFTTDAPSHPWGGDYRLGGELVVFGHEVNVAGTRINLQPSATLPLQAPGYYLTPKFKLWHTEYRLQHETSNLDKDSVTTVPVTSVDSGLFMERDTRFGSTEFMHTLEPRLFYLYSPYHDQSRQPTFDSGLPDFSYAQLFTENRFTGVDRVGDANQISVSLTTRLIDMQHGTEWLHAGLGRIYYFQDREVTLSGAAPETRSSSDVVGEVVAQMNSEWSATADVQWNPEIRATEKSGLQFHYQTGPRRILNAGYRYRREQLDQADVSFLWPLLGRWHGVGRWNYSFRDRRPLETLGGLEYESCCWALRFYTRKYINDTSGDYNHAVFMQVELKGLTSFGSPIEQILEHGILGYRPTH